MICMLRRNDLQFRQALFLINTSFFLSFCLSGAGAGRKIAFFTIIFHQIVHLGEFQEIEYKTEEITHTHHVPAVAGLLLPSFNSTQGPRVKLINQVWLVMQEYID